MDKNGVPHVLLIDDELSICTGVCGLLELMVQSRLALFDRAS